MSELSPYFTTESINTVDAAIHKIAATHCIPFAERGLYHMAIRERIVALSKTDYQISPLVPPEQREKLQTAQRAATLTVTQLLEEMGVSTNPFSVGPFIIDSSQDPKWSKGAAFADPVSRAISIQSDAVIHYPSEILQSLFQHELIHSSAPIRFENNELAIAGLIYYNDGKSHGVILEETLACYAEAYGENAIQDSSVQPDSLSFEVTLNRKQNDFLDKIQLLMPDLTINQTPNSLQITTTVRQQLYRQLYHPHVDVSYKYLIPIATNLAERLQIPYGDFIRHLFQVQHNGTVVQFMKVITKQSPDTAYLLTHLFESSYHDQLDHLLTLLWSKAVNPTTTASVNQTAILHSIVEMHKAK